MKVPISSSLSHSIEFVRFPDVFVVVLCHSEWKKNLSVPCAFAITWRNICSDYAKFYPLSRCESVEIYSYRSVGNSSCSHLDAMIYLFFSLTNRQNMFSIQLSKVLSDSTTTILPWKFLSRQQWWIVATGSDDVVKTKKPISLFDLIKSI